MASISLCFFALLAAPGQRFPDRRMEALKLGWAGGDGGGSVGDSHLNYLLDPPVLHPWISLFSSPHRGKA